MGRTPDRQNRYRVLLVEDDLGVLESTAAILSDDANIVAVTSAEGALRVLASERFDVVCTDYKMAGMNGVELLQRVSELPYAVGCLLITGNDEYLRSDSGSPYYVLVKPYEPDKLIRLVAQLARIARMKRDPPLTQVQLPGR
jgi:DNA-binding NtrC family response regulator